MYRSSQIGWNIVIPFSITLIGLPFILMHRELWHIIGAESILFVCLLLLYKLVIIVDDTSIFLRFGIGIVRKTVPLETVESCCAVKNHFLYGWGIHKIPGGWLYNVAGSHAVELQLRNGRKIRVGSHEPHKLKSAIDQRIQAS